MIISPLSVANSLALLTQATNGTTYAELRKGLHLSINKTAIANQFYDLNSKIKDDNYTIATVNQVYVQEKCGISEQFQQIANYKFASGVEHLNFRERNNSIRMVNQFFERKTNKTVQNIIMLWMLNKESNIILVNTIHFNNNWRYPFEKECTYRGDFFIGENETVEVEYMCIKTRNVYGPIHNYKRLNGLDASAVELYFGNTQFTFVIVLPNKRTGLTDLEAKLNDYELKYIMKSLGNERPYLTIPKFEIDFDIELNKILKNVCIYNHFYYSIMEINYFFHLQLNITEIFSDNADLSEFSGCNATFHVDKIIQKTHFGIDELGTLGTKGGFEIGGEFLMLFEIK